MSRFHRRSPPGRLPAPARWALRLLAPGRWRPDLERELGRAYARRRRDGRLRAALWLLRQLASPDWLRLRREIRDPSSLRLSRIRSPISDRRPSTDGDDPQGGSPMRDLLQELRIACRSLARRPAFSLVILTTLALGLAAAGGVFVMIDAVLLRPLPYPEAQELAMVWETDGELTGLDVGGRGYTTVSPANWTDWRRMSESFADIAAYNTWAATLSEGEGEPERVPAALVTWNFFDVLGVRPQLGAGLAPEHGNPGEDAVVLLSHSLWARRFGADPEIVGRTLAVDGERLEVVGVMPPRMRMPDADFVEDAQLWAPLAWEEPGHGRYLHPIGRLAPGRTVVEAQAEMDDVARRLRQERPVENRDAGVRVMSLREHVVGDGRRSLWLLLAAVTILLAIIVVNTANLVMARGEARDRELAVRAALGAGKGRLLRHVIVEALLLCLGGACLGLLLLATGFGALRVAHARFFPATPTPVLDHRAVLFGLAVAAVAGLVIGTVGALRLLRRDPRRTLAGEIRGARQTLGFRGGLVVAQVALAVVLLVTAGLLTRSFARLTGVPVGFDPDGVITFSVAAPQDRYEDAAAVGDLHRRLLRRLGAAPGVESATLSTDLPFTPSNMSSQILPDAMPAPEPGAEPSVEYRYVAPGYPELLGIPLLRGRDFGPDDVPDSPVALVNQAMAREFWPDGDAVGSTFEYVTSERPPVTVVGVVGDVLDDGFDGVVEPRFYRSLAQRPWRRVAVLVRVDGDVEAAVPALRAAVRDVDPLLPLADLRPLREIVDATVARSRAGMLLVNAMTAVALALAALGVYGILAYAVASRTREIGIRSALGADRRRIVAMMLRESLGRVLVGLLPGLLLAALVARLLESMLYEATAADAVVFALAAVCVAGAGALASLVPARRAAAVDPATVLRDE